MGVISAKYFLAANSADGFYGEFGNCYLPFEGWKAYIIKGGPGTGKSSFMRGILNLGEEKGLNSEIVHCTGDPDSLDAVIFPEIKKVIMDGTAPHVVDPVFPAVGDEILNFGEFWDAKRFSEPEGLKTAFKKNKLIHKMAGNYICAAGGVCRVILSRAEGRFNEKEVKNFAKMLVEKHLPTKESQPTQKVRFLGGVTPKGVKYFTENAIERAKTPLVVSDPYGAVADCVLKTVKGLALGRGYSVAVYKNPILPNNLLDAVEIPECELLFVREYCLNRCENVADKVYAEQFYKVLDYPDTTVDEGLLQNALSLATNTLKQAKQVHDEMEKHYINAMDFEKLKIFSAKFTENFFA